MKTQNNRLTARISKFLQGIFIPAMLIAVVVTSINSCVNLPDLNPNTNKNLVIRDIFEPFFYSYDLNYNFQTEIDINNNGTVDYIFAGYAMEHPMEGMTYRVMLEAANNHNKVISNGFVTDILCSTPVHMSPIITLNKNFAVNEFSSWEESGLLYACQDNINEGCEAHRRYVGENADEYFGLKFYDEGKVHFGWIMIATADLTSYGLPNCPDRFYLRQCAFNKIPDAGVRIPG